MVKGLGLGSCFTKALLLSAFSTTGVPTTHGHDLGLAATPTVK